MGMGFWALQKRASNSEYNLLLMTFVSWTQSELKEENRSLAYKYIYMYKYTYTSYISSNHLGKLHQKRFATTQMTVSCKERYEYSTQRSDDWCKKSWWKAFHRRKGTKSDNIASYNNPIQDLIKGFLKGSFIIYGMEGAVSGGVGEIFWTRVS